MKKLFTFLLYATMLFAVSCAEDFDDSQIWDKLNSLENRVAALEQLCKQMNTNISSLQTVVNALQNNDYVTNIAPITEDGKVIGYTITFSKSGAVTIYHGKDGKDDANGADGADGKDGYTPVIGVAKDTDDVYYWTLDGDWLLDKDGNKVKAEGVDGKDGQNGANGQDGKNGTTPKLKIENDNWYISYDNGATWTELGKATGEDGDSMFKDVTYDDDYVYIILIDGTKITMPRVPKISNNEIWYISTNNSIITPHKEDAFGANIISNRYIHELGRGVITFDKDISEIGKSAFYNCTKLAYITIPNSVTSIGGSAFGNCVNLESIIIPDGVTSIEASTFYYCSNLERITIPNSVTSIGSMAFIGCSSLKSITIPDGVTSIEAYTFSDCTNLEHITIPNNVTSIGEEAFSKCYGLTNITIPDSVTTIGDCAFMNCTGLTTITLNKGLKTIGWAGFANCLGLTNIELPNSIEAIGSQAFYYCPNIENIFCAATTPPACGAEPFYECASLAKIYVPTASVDAYKAATNWSFYTDLIEGYNFE